MLTKNHLILMGKKKSLPLDIYKNNLVLCFSYYKVLSSYKGYCVRVRRSLDNATQDFGFVNNYIDYVGILAFCNGSSGYVPIWYNQGSILENLVQVTTTRQPRIVNTGVFEVDGLYNRYTSSGEMYMSNDGLSTSLSNFTVITSFETPTSNTNERIITKLYTSNYSYIIRKRSNGVYQCLVQTSGGFYAANDINSITINMPESLTMTYDGSNVRAYLNGVLKLTMPSTAGNMLYSANNLYCGSGNTEYFNGNIKSFLALNKKIEVNDIIKIKDKVT